MPALYQGQRRHRKQYNIAQYSNTTHQLGLSYIHLYHLIMVKEPGKTKKIRPGTYHHSHKPFPHKRFPRVELPQVLTPSAHHSKNPDKVQPTPAYDHRLIECVKNVLATMKIESYVQAVEQLRHLYDYVGASISFGQYQTGQGCSLDQLQSLLFCLLVKKEL